jgi:hypothetical protein
MCNRFVGVASVLQQKQAEKANFYVTGSIAHVADICDIMIYLL